MKAQRRVSAVLTGASSESCAAFLVGSQGPGPTRNGPYFGPQQQMQLPIGSLLASFKVGAPGVVACSRNSIKVRAGAIRYGEDRTQHSSSAKATSPIVRGKGSPRNMPTAVFAYTLRLASDHHEHGDDTPPQEESLQLEARIRQWRPHRLFRASVRGRQWDPVEPFPLRLIFTARPMRSGAR